MEKESAALPKKNLTATLYTMKSMWKLKWNLIMEKSTQMLTIKHQKKALSVFVYQ